MVEKYAILDANNGWLLNVILWDGNLETWQPPAGTIVELLSNVDIDNLPQSPQ